MADLSRYRAELVRDSVARHVALRQFERSAEYIQYVREYSREARDLLLRRAGGRRVWLGSSESPKPSAAASEVGGQPSAVSSLL